MGVSGLLRALLAVTEEAVQALDQEELDLDRVTQLMEQRGKLFTQIQEEFGDGDTDDPEHRELVREILALDRTCMEAVRKHGTRVQAALSDVKLRQRTMKAYGWVDPEFAPRGAFVDYK